MKIDDVLECLNKTLDELRAKRGITTKGHFVSTMNIKKSMGPYKQCYITIIYVNLDSKINTPVSEGTYMERVLVDRVEEFISVAERYALTKLFIKLNEPNLWENITIGEYGSK